MQCGVGQFTRLLSAEVEKLDPGSSTILTLTRADGSLADIWRAAGSAASVVCNFPIVAWKRVILPPLAALAIAKLRRRRIVLIQHEWGGLNWMRRISYIPALLLADTIIMFSSLVRRELADDPLLGWTVEKMRAGAAAAEHRGACQDRRIRNFASGSPRLARAVDW